MKLEDLKNELLKNEEFKSAYNKYDLALELSQMLFEARLIKGITQEKLADLVGTKQSGIARLETGKGLPSLSFLNKIAIALKTNLVVKFGFMEKNQIINVSQNSNAHLIDMDVQRFSYQAPHKYYFTAKTDTLSNYLVKN